MKLFAILAFVGFAAAFPQMESGSLKWQPGQEYVYTYNGRLLTGLPELSQHQFSGLGIKCQVHLQVLSDTKLVLQVRDTHYSRVNQVLSSMSGEHKEHNWRYLQMPAYTPVPAQTMRLLEKPTAFEISEITGKVKSLTVSAEEPEWSVNFKKALIAIFQTGTLEKTEIRTVESEVTSNSKDHGIPHVWTTFEESVDGECETKYELSKLPVSMTSSVDVEGEKLISMPEMCQESSQVYELIKVRNLNNCHKTSKFNFHTPGSISCSNKDHSEAASCGETWTRSSVTRYTLCEMKSNPNRLLVQSIVNEGELNQYLMLVKTEKVLTGSRQVLKLIHSGRIESRLPEESTGSIVISTLLYGKKSASGNVESVSEFSESMKDFNGHKINKEEIIKIAEELVKEIAHADLFTEEGLPEKEISFKALTLARTFMNFNRRMFEQVYESTVRRSQDSEKTEVIRNILVDTIVMSGTPESIKFFKHLIERRELPHSQIAALFLNLPRSIMMPTKSLLEELFELITSETIRSDVALYNNAIISFSHLLEKACISSEKKVNYPVEYFGKFCDKESAIITEKWIPYLQKELYKSESSVDKKNAIVMALSMLSHPQILPVVLPILEEPIRSEDSHMSHFTRYFAVYSLLNVGRHYSERVLPIVSAIYVNRAEPTIVRIAAFQTIMGLNPDMALLQKIATLTWSEEDTELLKTVNTAFYSLTQSSSMNDYNSETSALIRKVRLVYPLLKKTGGRFPSSATLFSNEFLNKMKVGYESINSWTGCKNSVLPALFYNKITYFLNDYKFTPLEFGVKICDVIPKIVDTISGTAFENKDEVKSQLASEWRKTIDTLRLKIEENSSPEAFVYFRIFEDSTIFRSFSSSAGQELERVLKNPSVLRSYLNGEKKLDYQRVFNLMNHARMIPSDLGFPIYSTLSMPAVVSVRGHVASEVSSSMKFSVNFKALVDARLTGQVGTICPFTGELIETGIDSHIMVNLPFNIIVHANLPEGKITLNVNSNHITRPIDLVYTRVLPYTVNYRLYSSKSLLSSENLKVIKTITPKHENEYHFGEYLGLEMKALIKSETPYMGMRYVLEKLSLFNYNPINYVKFAGIMALDHSGLPSSRSHELRVQYNPQSSSTKEFEFTLKFGAGIKESKSEPIKYVKIEQVNSEIIPLKVVAKTVGEHRGHQQRQEKIRNILESQRIESEGHAFTVSFVAALKGSSRPKTYSYSATIGTGKSGLKQKWDLKVESNVHAKKICVSGDLELPIYSIWSLEQLRSENPIFHFSNVIGYGSECTESQIVVKGFAKTSSEQKRLSQESPEARELRILQEKNVPMIQLSELSEIVRRQASNLNEFQYKIDMINVPSKVVYYHKSIMNFISVYFWPYLRMDIPAPSMWSQVPIKELEYQLQRSSQVSTLIRTKVHPSRRTFDTEITDTMGEKMLFKDIPIPYPFHYVLPLSYVRDPVSAIAKGTTGKPLFPTCNFEGKHISTYDNRTLKAEIDDCFHLLSGDCSKNMEYGVLVRSTDNYKSEKEIKVFIKDTTVTMKREGSEIVVKVNGSPIEVAKTEVKPIKSSLESRKTVATIIKTKDNVIVFKSSKISVYFDGKIIKLEGSLLLKNKLCGLCGDNNNDKAYDVTSPQKCLLSKPELLVASHRVPTLKACRPLSGHIERELKRETERCVKKPESRPTKVSYSSLLELNSRSESCMNHHHEVVDKYESNEYCYSRIPVLECGSMCHPVEVREKEVTFTCMKKNRTSEHIAEKIQRGEIIPSLKNMPVTYTTTRSVPVTCKPYSNMVETY